MLVCLCADVYFGNSRGVDSALSSFVLTARRTMLLCLSRPSLTGIFGGLMAAAEGGQDRDGPLVAEGRLLSGHEIQQFRKGFGRPADRSKASTGCGSRFAGQAAPGARRASAAGAQVTVDLAGDVTLEAADDLLLSQAFLGAPLDVGAGGGMGAHPGDDDPPQG